MYARVTRKSMTTIAYEIWIYVQPTLKILLTLRRRSSRVVRRPFISLFSSPSSRCLKVLRLENFLQPESERAVSPDRRGHIEWKPSERRRGRIRERWIQHHPRRLPRVRVHRVHQTKHSNEYRGVFAFIQLRSVFASVRLVGVVHEFWNEFPIRDAVLYERERKRERVRWWRWWWIGI